MSENETQFRDAMGNIVVMRIKCWVNPNTNETYKHCTQPCHECQDDEGYCGELAFEEDKPQVGMGATLLLWSDTHAYSISRVSQSGKVFWMKRDNAELDKSFKPDTVEGGFVGHTRNNSDQKYTYTPDSNAEEVRVTMTKRGWHCRNGTVIVGKRSEFYDYNF